MSSPSPRDGESPETGVFVIGKYCRGRLAVVCAFDSHQDPDQNEKRGTRETESRPCRSLATQSRDRYRAPIRSNETVRRPRAVSLNLAERHLVVHFLGLLLILTVAALALRTARLFQGTPTAAVGAHRLSSERQGGYHRRSGRFVVKNPLDLAHYVCVQLRDKLGIKLIFFLLSATAISFDIF